MDKDEQVNNIIADYRGDKNLGFALGRFFLIEFPKKADLELLKKLFPTTSDDKLLKEWFAFNVFMMTIALAGHFNSSDEGATVTQKFNETIGNELFKRGMFVSPIDYVHFVGARVDEYWQEHSKKPEDYNGVNGVYWRAKKFCENVGELTDMSQITTIGGWSSNIMIADKEFIDGINKSV